MILLLYKNNILIIFVLLLTVTCTSHLITVVPVHAHSPTIDDLTASRTDSTVTLTILVNHQMSNIHDDVKMQAIDYLYWIYKDMDRISHYEVDVDGVVEAFNHSKWWVNWEEERLYIDPETTTVAQDEGPKVTIEHELSDATDGTVIRVRVASYAYPENEYTYSAWTEAQTVEDLLTKSSSPCLIATATYGSELTPQVQFLRTFRDDRVLQTFAGSQFMEVFNSFYYSWSPTIADTIRTHDSVATVMQPVLYPLIGILQISEGIFSVLSFHPELVVIASGSVASALIAGIYLLPLMLLISYLRKKAVSRTLVSAIGVIWLASLCAIVLAELTQSAALMMTATGTFVLATMVATMLSMMTVIPAVLKNRSQ